MRINSKWVNIKKDVRKRWGKVTDFELEQTGGDLEAIKELIETKYLDSSILYRDKLTDIYKKRLKNN